MFEHNGVFYNPRFVLKIGEVLSRPNGVGLFEVVWHDGEKTVFVFDTPQDADQQRHSLAFQVNKSNGD
ncbi:hypothetical protein [Stenotrophomonas sp. TWI587]|uniref:hypothetical protein n=1 Tax=Stenotrophomonas sp. TWI587 TaxID=3136783 RepID=UPI003208EA4A